MELEVKINNEIKVAMLARDKRKLEALRAIKAAILIEKTGKDASSGEIPESVEMKLLQKLVKQRKESADIYLSQGRPDLAEEETYQASIIQEFLPAQMEPKEVEAVIERIINESGASGIKDIGKVMGAATKELAGKADNKMIAEIVRSRLTG